MGMLVASTGFENIVYQYYLALLVALAVFSHYSRAWIVHSGTIYYSRLMSYAVYHCEVVILQ